MSQKLLLSVIAIAGLFLSLGMISVDVTRNVFGSVPTEDFMGEQQIISQELEWTPADNATTLAAENATTTLAPTNDTTTTETQEPATETQEPATETQEPATDTEGINTAVLPGPTTAPANVTESVDNGDEVSSESEESSDSEEGDNSEEGN